MSAQDRAIQKLARELAGIKKEVVSWRGPQADYTSIENSGNFTFKDGDGNVTAVVGGQDDGSNTIRHVDGPTPPIPSGLSAHVDGPIIQVSWDGTFEDADNATYDWSHLEVIAVGPSNENLRGTISDATGASTNLAATSSGVWTVVARSVSRAEKRSLDGDAGTVDVELVDIDGAIEAVQDSANGKNKVTYDSRPPTSDDPGIFGDTWFVGQVGRPNDIVEATNLATNPSFTSLLRPMGAGENMSAGGGAALSVDSSWSAFGDTSLRIGPGSSNSSAAYVRSSPTNSPDGDWAGKTVTISATIRLAEPMTGATDATGERSIVVGYRAASGGTVWTHARSNVAPNSAGVTRCVVTTTLPSSDMSNWFIRLFNGSTTVPVWWDGLDIAEASAARPFFDGDTPSGATDNESHYRWTGTPHASASEKYLPAIPDSGSDSWNITEQWQFTSSGWLPVELNHEVIATVDLGKATVGELDGIRIAAQTIRGQQLSGDAIDGKVITGATYRTTGGTGSWSDDGLFIAQPDGTSMVRFPTDGSPLSLTASDVQIDRASIADLDLSYGAVRSGGQVTLASGVTAPASPPELTTGWQKVATLDKPDPGVSYDWLGLGYWDNGTGWWVRAVNVLGAAGDTLDVFEVYDNDGIFSKSIQLDINPRAGVTVIGDVAYTLGPDKVERPGADPNWVHGFDLNTGARVSRWEFTRFPGGAGGRFATGTDGTNVVITGITPARTLYVLRYNPATGAQVGSDWTTPTGSWTGGQDLEGVHVSGTEVTILPQQTARVYTASGNTLTRKTDTSNASGFAGWNNPNKNGAGMVMLPGRFGAVVPFVVDGTGAVYEGSQFTSDTTVVSHFTWFDGTHETTPSPTVSNSFLAREATVFSLPARAGLQKRLYFRFGAGAWNRVTLPDALTTVSWMDMLNYSPASAEAPTTNTFPNADPATLKSVNNKFEVKGDGSGHWGNFNVDANGAMSGLIVTGQVVITPDAANVSKLATVTLPPGRFTRPPVVWVSVGTSAPHKAFAGCYQPTDTNTFNVYLNRDSTTTTGIQWYAMDGE